MGGPKSISSFRTPVYKLIAIPYPDTMYQGYDGASNSSTTGSNPGRQPSLLQKVLAGNGVCGLIINPALRM